MTRSNADKSAFMEKLKSLRLDDMTGDGVGS
jgi:hypothetical protein